MNPNKIKNPNSFLFQIEEIVSNNSKDECCTMHPQEKEHYQDNLKGIKSIIYCSWNSIALN